MRIIAVLAWFCFFAVACDTNGTPVDSGACEGCRTREGACVAGDQTDACGTAGAACMTCSSGQTCALGACGAPESCGPGTCDGCCSGGTCITEVSDATCGAQGRACTACDPGEMCAEGTCAAPPTCGPENCTGCCQGNTCVQPGMLSEAACGLEGLACSQCVNATCDTVRGVCVPTCSPDNCDGCCDETGTCRSLGEMQDDTHCGRDGGQCGDCGSLDGTYVCHSGICIGCGGGCEGCCAGAICWARPGDSNCGVNGAPCMSCGDGRTCDLDTGSCIVNPDALWNLTLVSGEIPATDPSGSAWDIFGGLPDPVITLTVGPGTADEASQTSSIVDDNTIGNWNETLFNRVPARALLAGVQVEWYDADVGPDMLITRCTQSLDASVFDGRLIEIRCSSSIARLRVTF